MVWLLLYRGWLTSTTAACNSHTRIRLNGPLRVGIGKVCGNCRLSRVVLGPGLAGTKEHNAVRADRCATPFFRDCPLFRCFVGACTTVAVAVTVNEC
uniref:Putative secreted protein n=1 Tax=Anopheles marajoara TaxID=58244 RepID=A0A2M4C9P9_9DIPT